jgi:archaellum component FlaC
MTIDERLDRLTARHEALTQTVELITADIAQLTLAVATQSRTMDNVLIGISTLAQIAQGHEARIDRLEGR